LSHSYFLLNCKINCPLYTIFLQGSTVAVFDRNNCY
jgi:hypothetical protein